MDSGSKTDGISHWELEDYFGHSERHDDVLVAFNNAIRTPVVQTWRCSVEWRTLHPHTHVHLSQWPCLRRIPTPCSMVRTPRSPSFSSVDSRRLLCHSNDPHHDLDGVDAFPCLRWHRRLVRVLHRPGLRPVSILVQAQDITSPSTKKEPTAPFFMRFPNPSTQTRAQLGKAAHVVRVFKNLRCRFDL